MSNKSEVLSFDEWINGNGFNFRPEQYDLYKFLYESGQQSKQDEVDELHKRIDDAWMLCEKGCILKAMEILKGEETNENLHVKNDQIRW